MMWKAEKFAQQIPYRASGSADLNEPEPEEGEEDQENKECHIIVLLGYGMAGLELEEGLGRDIERIQELIRTSTKQVYIITSTLEDHDVNLRFHIEDASFVKHVKCNFQLLCERWTRSIALPRGKWIEFTDEDTLKHISTIANIPSVSEFKIEVQRNNEHDYKRLEAVRTHHYVRTSKDVMYVNPPFQKIFTDLEEALRKKSITPVSCSVHLDHFWLENNYYRLSYGMHWLLPGGWCEYFLTAFKNTFPTSKANFVTLPIDASGNMDAMMNKSAVSNNIKVHLHESSDNESNVPKQWSVMYAIARQLYDSELEEQHKYLHSKPFMTVTSTNADMNEVKAVILDITQQSDIEDCFEPYSAPITEEMPPQRKKQKKRIELP